MKLTEEGFRFSSALTRDALRTEPDYAAALQRMQQPGMLRLWHVAAGLATETGEFIDMLKKHIYYGKPLDRTNAVEELGDLTWYERIGCDELEVAYLQMVLINVEKLKHRFPEKFAEAQALVRDLEGERKILEGEPGETARANKEPA